MCFTEFYPSMQLFSPPTNYLNLSFSLHLTMYMFGIALYCTPFYTYLGKSFYISGTNETRSFIIYVIRLSAFASVTYIDYYRLSIIYQKICTLSFSLLSCIYENIYCFSRSFKNQFNFSLSLSYTYIIFNREPSSFEYVNGVADKYKKCTYLPSIYDKNCMLTPYMFF